VINALSNVNGYYEVKGAAIKTDADIQKFHLIRLKVQSYYDYRVLKLFKHRNALLK